MSVAIARMMKDSGFTSVENNIKAEGFKTQTFSYGNSQGIILVNFGIRERNGKILVSTQIHSGAGWMKKPITLNTPEAYFNTPRQRAIIARRIARFVRNLND